MKHWLVRTIIPAVLFFTACSNKPPESNEKKPRLVFHFELDSTGNITDTIVKSQLSELAVRINANADRIAIYSYTQKMSNAEESVGLAKLRGDAAKEVMFKAAGERIYYNVGVEARGFENPVNVADPAAAANRRIEIEYLQ